MTHPLPYNQWQEWLRMELRMRYFAEKFRFTIEKRAEDEKWKELTRGIEQRYSQPIVENYSPEYLHKNF